MAANGNIFVTTSAGLRVYDGQGGALLWTVNAAPPSGSLQGGYTPIGTFDPNQGQLALVRCLGDQQQQGSMCVYSGYAPAPPAPGSSSAAPRGSWLAAAAAGGALLLLLL